VLRRTFAGALAAAAMLLPVTTAVSAPTVAAAPILATTLTYDDSQAAEFKQAVASGVAVWNSLATNVRIVKATAGQRVNIRVIADNGWPRANLGPVRPTGTVTVWFGREAVNEGYNLVRIAAHELGHSLGLPDIKPGPCSSLMSGSTGGVSCTNTRPNASELARVQRNYAGTLQSQNTDTSTILSEAAF
jgi:snapalysin